MLKWPSQSPGLNHTEHIQDVVEREIPILDVQPTDIGKLWSAIIIA